MSYTVFARKYRPQTFDDIIGQDHIVRTLKNAITNNRLAHAYIFVGPRGTGKTSTARILAKALNCVNGPTTQPCGQCDACREIAAGTSLDVLEFDAASNTQVEKVRDIIIDNVKYLPSRGKFKMYIVDEVHMLSPGSFNALLKTLEEPPEHVKFVFATTDVQKVPTTIISRCQRFDLKRIPTALIRDHLLMIAGKENVELTPAGAEAVAHGADGGMRDAESMLDQLVAFCGDKIDEEDVLRVFGFTAQQTVASLCESLISGDTPAALGIIQEQAEAGKDLTRLLGDLIEHVRNLLVAKADPSALGDELTAEALQAITEQAERVDFGRLLELIEQFASAEQRMKWAPNKKMYLEVAIIRAVQTLNSATLGEVLDTLTAIRGGGALPATPAPPKSGTPTAKPRTTSKPTPPANPAPASVVPPSPAPKKPAAAGPSAEKPTAPAPPPERPREAPKPVSSPELWNTLIERVRNSRPLMAASVEAGTLLELSEKFAVIGFPPDQTISADFIDAPQNRPFIESLLSEITGRPISFKCVTREGLLPNPPPRPAELAPEKPVDPVASFRDDEIIRRALEIFRAEIQPA